MSTKTFDSGEAFGKPRTASVWSTIADSLTAIREGIDLAGEYKELTSRGMASDEAARKVFNKIGQR